MLLLCQEEIDCLLFVVLIYHHPIFHHIPKLHSDGQSCYIMTAQALFLNLITRFLLGVFFILTGIPECGLGCALIGQE